MVWTKRIAIAAGVVILLLVAGFVALGFAPVEEDPYMDPREGGAGASSIEDSQSGLQREFPPMNWPEETPNTPEAIERVYRIHKEMRQRARRGEEVPYHWRW